MNRPVIIGGGQLALMLLEAWQDLSLHYEQVKKNPPIVLNAGPACSQHLAETVPVEKFADELGSEQPLFVEVDIKNAKELADFLEKSAAKKVGFEIETVDLSLAKKLDCSFFPSTEIVELIQSKVKQKQWFKAENISSADFKVYENIDELKQESDLSFPKVLKASSGGYDGRGVAILKSAIDLETQNFAGEVLLEDFLQIESELGVIVVADHLSQKVFPAVEMFFSEENQLDYLLSPASNCDLKIKEEAEATALEIAKKLGLQGVLAIEFIVTKDQNLYVNEMAPRPHNSGHHTIEAFNESQFSMYLRVLYGLDLPEIKPNSNFAALANIVGIEAAEKTPVFQLDEMDKVFLHNYQKTNKLHRKIGHLTVLGDEPESLVVRLKNLQNNLGFDFDNLAHQG